MCDYIYILKLAHQRVKAFGLGDDRCDTTSEDGPMRHLCPVAAAAARAAPVLETSRPQRGAGGTTEHSFPLSDLPRQLLTANGAWFNRLYVSK